MNPVSPGQLLEQLNWRYATKQFDPSRKIPVEQWDALEQSLVLAPSSIGLQPWRFLVVNDPETRAKLKEVSYGQSQITDASHLVVFAAKTDFLQTDIDAHIARAAAVRGVEVEALAGFQAMATNSIMVNRDEAARQAWAIHQTYIASGVLVTSAAMLGIDACPMEGIDKSGYERILNLREAGLSAVMTVALGYRSSADKYGSLPKVRFPREELIRHI